MPLRNGEEENQGQEPSVLVVSPDNIENYRQNKASLIIGDAKQLFGADEYKMAKVLMSRGVMKWFAVRRDLIRLKDIWRARLRELYPRQGVRSPEERGYWKGYIKALEECRKEVRALCHSSRWRIPDNDEEVGKWL